MILSGFLISVSGVYALVPLRDFAGVLLQRYCRDYPEYYERMDPAVVSSLSDPVLDFSFIPILRDFIDNESIRLADARYWVPEPSNMLFKFFDRTCLNSEKHLNANDMMLWAQKKLVEPGVSLHCIGDLHGDMRSLLLILLDLDQQGMLHADYTLEPNNYIIFLGDYVDRGPYSLDVLAMVLYLKTKNPEQVVVSRGNHEEHTAIIPNSHIPFLVGKLVPEGGVAQDALLRDINKAYNLLPCALFVGVKRADDAHTDYVMLSHGGIEPLYNPQILLGMDDLCQYEFIYWDYHNQLDMRETRARKSSQMLHKKINSITFREAGYGHLWSDVLMRGYDCGIFGEPSIRLAFGKRMLEAAFSQACDGLDAKIHMLIRGHQHALGSLHATPDHMVYTVIPCAEMLDDIILSLRDPRGALQDDNCFGTRYVKLKIDDAAQWQLLLRHIEYNNAEKKVIVQESQQVLPASLKQPAGRDFGIHVYGFSIQVHGDGEKPFESDASSV